MAEASTMVCAKKGWELAPKLPPASGSGLPKGKWSMSVTKMVAARYVKYNVLLGSWVGLAARESLTEFAKLWLPQSERGKGGRINQFVYRRINSLFTEE